MDLLGHSIFGSGPNEFNFLLECSNLPSFNQADGAIYPYLGDSSDILWSGQEPVPELSSPQQSSTDLHLTNILDSFIQVPNHLTSVPCYNPTDTLTPQQRTLFSQAPNYLTSVPFYNPTDTLPPLQPAQTSPNPVLPGPGPSSRDYSVLVTGIVIGCVLAISTPAMQHEKQTPQSNYLETLPGISSMPPIDSASSSNPAPQYYFTDPPSPPLYNLGEEPEQPSSSQNQLLNALFNSLLLRNLTAGAAPGLCQQAPVCGSTANPSITLQALSLTPMFETQHPELPGNLPGPNSDRAATSPESVASSSQTHTAQTNQESTLENESTLISHVSLGRGWAKNPSHRCATCNKPFRRPHLLKDHERTHTGEITSIYHCEFEGCTRAYKSRSNMGRHFKSHYAENTQSPLRTSDQQMPDEISEQPPVTGLSTHKVHGGTSAHRSDRGFPNSESGSIRFRPYETPDSVRRKGGKSKE